MKPFKIVKHCFWAGFLLYGCMNQMFMDLMGKEGYLRKIEEHWVDTHWSLWLFLTLAVYFYFMYITHHIPEDKDDG